jgi:hypothetical protein
MVIMVSRALLSLEELGLEGALLALILLHLAVDGIFLKGLVYMMLLARVLVDCEGGRV